MSRTRFGAGIKSRPQFLPADSCAGTSWYDPPVNADLRERGHLLVKGLIEPCLARVLYKTLLLKHWRGESFRDNHIPTASAVTDDATVDALLLELVPRISEIVGFPLVPSYGYARVYFHGDAIVRHRDRPACEISTSIHLGRHGGDSSLWFAPNARVEMDEGDAAVYLGCEAEHWREPFNGNTMGQMFLHYVVAEGRFAQNSFDGRPNRFPPSISKARS
jgi:hypothetical protein